jgi:DNA-directed RNA polymerase specialized sigma24 family protein
MAREKAPAKITVQFRMSAAERKTFAAQAKRKGLSLSAWLRMIAHNEVANERKRESS